MLQKLQVKLVEKKDLTHDVMLLRFALDLTMSAISGQYMIIFVPNGTDQPYRRLYSIASDCANFQNFDIVAKIIPGGVASEYFKTLNIGAMVHVEGPAGVFHLKNDTHDSMFLATGTGIAPIWSMLHELLLKNPNPDHKIYLLWGLRKHTDVYFLEKFKELMAQYPNFIFKICLSREESMGAILPEDQKYFAIGRITNFYDGNDFQPTNTNFYLCGDRQVVESLRQYLYDKGLSRDAVIFEKF